MNFEQYERQDAKMIYSVLGGMMVIGILLLSWAYYEKEDIASSDEIVQFCESEICDL